MSQVDKYEYSSREHDLRHFLLMQRMIEQYRDGSIGLGRLVDSLEALNGVLRIHTERWASEFERAWGTLEDVYSVMRTEEHTQPDENSLGLIEGSISRLESLLTSELSKAGPLSQD